MPDATSVRQLAKTVGRSHKTVLEWLKRKDFPVSREGPWSEDDQQELKVWASVKLQPNRNDPNYIGRTTEPPADEQDKDYWLMRKYRAQALEAEGELVNASAIKRQNVRDFAELRERMEQVGPATAALCVGLPVGDIERLITNAVIDAIEDIATRLGDAETPAGDPAGEPSATNEAEEPDAEQMGGDE